MHWPFVYLASASPRRHEILDQMGVPHQVLQVPSPEGEDEPQLPGEPAEVYVERTAREKAQRAVAWLDQQQGMYRTAPVLSADTTVILRGEILGKPENAQHAARLLRALSGTTHQVRTAVVMAQGTRLLEKTSVSTVTFQALDDADIENYCASGEPMGKAGAYGIQGLAGIFISHLSGSYTGVMGLPMHETAQLLRAW
jgi:septum formation protein